MTHPRRFKVAEGDNFFTSDGRDIAETMGVYLIHFDKPFSHARHYIGYGDDLDKRTAEQLAGKGAVLTQKVYAAGIEMTVARIWRGATREFEAKLKIAGHSKLHCPICMGDKARK